MQGYFAPTTEQRDREERAQREEREATHTRESAQTTACRRAFRQGSKRCYTSLQSIVIE